MIIGPLPARTAIVGVRLRQPRQRDGGPPEQHVPRVERPGHAPDPDLRQRLHPAAISRVYFPNSRRTYQINYNARPSLVVPK